jgi:SOS-response transcriptional repressor LexA
VLIPLLKPTTANDLEERQDAQVNVRVALLKAMIAEPKGSIQAWTDTVGLKSKSTTHGHLVRLAKENLVDKALDRYFVTPKGRKAIEAA